MLCSRWSKLHCKRLTLDLNYLIDINRVENDHFTTNSLHFSIIHGSFKSFTQCHTCKYVRIRSVKFNPDTKVRSQIFIQDPGSEYEGGGVNINGSEIEICILRCQQKVRYKRLFPNCQNSLSTAKLQLIGHVLLSTNLNNL